MIISETAQSYLEREKMSLGPHSKRQLDNYLF